MEAQKKQLKLIDSDQSQSKTSKTSDKFQERESNELVIGFSGPVGSGVGLVSSITQEILEEIGYEVVKVKISDIIIDAANSYLGEDITINKTDRKERYEKLQSGGDNLRKRLQTEILSELAIRKISLHRKAKQLEESEGNEGSIRDYVPTKTAYLIDQLKHPDEISLLRTVYGNLFFLVGVLASKDQRFLALKDEGLAEQDASYIMERDRKEDIKHGQQLEKTLHLSDYFVRNNHANRQILKIRLERFIKLVHGENGITPSADEYGMYVAYASGLKSACLSRQVGASISDMNGNIVSSGCNDVPKAGGGLYTYSDEQLDNRCVNKGHCFNDKYKDKVTLEIDKILQDELDISSEDSERIAKEIKSTSRLKDLIEFSRAVHAEMDAITSVARNGGVSISGGTIYVTTFPCHNCARHIIASGLSHVVYIEPYEKSLALELHGDDIALDPPESPSKLNKVVFLHFEGVSPRQYQSFFAARSDRKKDGNAITTPLRVSKKVSPEYLDSYIDFELKVIDNLDKLNTKGSGDKL